VPDDALARLSMSPLPRIRAALADDRSAVAATVAGAFAEDPAWAFIMGPEYGRLAARFAAALFDLRLASRSVWVSDDVAAVAMWDPPDRAQDAAERARGVWAGYAAAAGEQAMVRLGRYNDAVAAVAPPGRYWYLGVLATDPLRRGDGLASAVLAPILAEADRDGLVCCLETSTEYNRRFYGGRGFTEATEVRLPGGPPTWWLLRAPTAR
jgi:GNAT superfamily N-acetyltransferase